MRLAARLATRVPMGGAPRRTYSPGGPLYARRPLKFQGVTYAKGDSLPVANMSKSRHLKLWMAGLADHVQRGPFDKRRKVTDAAPPAPTSPPEATVPAGAATLEQAPASPSAQRHGRRR